MGDRLGIPGVVGILLPRSSFIAGACGATVARLTPDQKVACSNHVGLIFLDALWHPFLDSEVIWGHRGKKKASLGGLEPPTFRLTAERANRLRHRDLVKSCLFNLNQFFIGLFYLPQDHLGVKLRVAWPSGLRRWFKAPVSSEAWVRIPPLPGLFRLNY